MLKFINYQLDDEATQTKLEQDISPLVQQTIRSNLSAFRQYHPPLLDLINQNELTDHSVFCTKSGQLNIVNVTTGRVTYGPIPEQEMQAEAEQFTANAPFFRVVAAGGGFASENLPSGVDVVLMFGCGLGYQLLPLLQSSRIRFLVIYEPEIENFLCSIHSTDWLQIFELAAAMGTQLSFQIGNAGTSIAEDIQELCSLVPSLEKIYLYRHLCHPVSDEVVAFLFENSGRPDVLQRKGRQFRGYNESTDFISEHPKNVLALDTASDNTSVNMQVFTKNMAVFARFYPDVYKLFCEYKPQNWFLRQDCHGNNNLWHARRRAYFYDNAKHDSDTLVRHYLAEPFKDDVIVGQAASEKFSSFVHFKYIKKLQEIFLAFKTEKKPLPEKVDSLIVFGVALGLHVQYLFSRRDITNLYICEPNLDFFYASLLVTDWAEILNKAEQQKKRIYLNIGGDGSEYFSDLMGQFYQVGAFAIANTYLLSSYYSPALLKAIQSLKQQLKVVLAMGEFYDHARFGMAHTYLSMQSGHQFMRDDLSSLRNMPAAHLPVFIIGNGPSLDSSIDFIKEHRDKAVVVSCGTAIRSLYKLGVLPDFHAEVEQNRATYDWITQVNDMAYLKRIKLISVNGIHPDTASLFEQVYLAFKDGEAATQVFRDGLKERGINVSSLSYAYPTVSNMALNFVIRMQFKAIYLFGVDLGYADVSQHHSKYSAYYTEGGKEVYDYKQFHGLGFPVKGNFRPFVYTKPEFDVSKRLIEQVVATTGAECEIYNCSDGAFIKGINPLQPTNILLSAKTQLRPKDALEDYLQQAFIQTPLAKIGQEIFASYSISSLEASIAKWIDIIPDKGIFSRAEASQCIDSQWYFLRSQVSEGNNLLFYLFYGSANYFLSVLTKMLPAEGATDEELSRFNTVLSYWQNYLSDAIEDFVSQPIKSDKVTVNYLPKPTM